MKFASISLIIILIFLPIIIDGFVIVVKNVRSIISGPLMIQVTCLHDPTFKEQIFMDLMAENQVKLNIPSDATRKCATKSYEFTISELTLQNVTIQFLSICLTILAPHIHAPTSNSGQLRVCN